MNWNQLKDFCNSLTEEQLQKNVLVWREDKAFSNMEPIVLNYDMYIGLGEEGCYPLHEVDLTEEQAEEEGLTKVYSKGDPILMEDF